MQINSTNFIRFYTGSIDDDVNTIPRLALIDNKCYCPVYVSGERAAFYCNASLPFLDSDDFDNLELRILDSSGNVVNNLGAILQKVTLASGYRFYADFIFPDISLAQYQFQVFNTDTNTVKVISNWFQTLDTDTANKTTVSVVWRNSRSNYYYDFALFPDFYCRIRLHLSLQSYTPEGTIEQLQSVNTGRRRNLNRTVDESVKLQTYYFDDAANKACIALFEADDIQINGMSYLSKTIYAPNTRSNSKISTGEIELYEQDFSSINKYGQLPVQLTNSGYVAFKNNTEILFRLKSFTENNILFLSIEVFAGQSVLYSIGDIPYNGKVDFVPAATGTYNVQQTSVVNNDFTYSDGDVTGGVSLSLTRVQIYNTDWTVVISS